MQLEQQRRSSTGSSSSTGSPAAGKTKGDGDGERQLYSFADLFKAIRIEDFSSYISKVGDRVCAAGQPGGVGEGAQQT